MIRALNKLYIFLLLCIPIISYAAVPAWEMIPNESSITFVGTQNGAQTEGSFKRFKGEIYFAPTELKASHVKIIIDMTSVHTSFKDLEDALKTDNWLAIALYPDATFIANNFTSLGENKYNAKGTLTIRDKSISTDVIFSAQELSKTKVRVKGTTTLKRTVFGIGQGEWGSTDEVKDDVQVNFVITAIKK